MDEFGTGGIWTKPEANLFRRDEVTCEIPDGAVFLCDPTRVQGLTIRNTPVVTARDCISLWTRLGAEGPVTLVLTDREGQEQGIQLFRGTLRTDGRKLAFRVSDGPSLVQVDLTTREVHIRIHADHPQRPSKLVCVIEDPVHDTGARDWAEELMSWLFRFLRGSQP